MTGIFIVGEGNWDQEKQKRKMNEEKTVSQTNDHQSSEGTDPANNLTLYFQQVELKK